MNIKLLNLQKTIAVVMMLNGYITGIGIGMSLGIATVTGITTITTITPSGL